MSNALNEDLTGKVVIFGQEYLSAPAESNPFLVTGGYGAHSFTTGRALFGVFLSDGEKARMEGFMVARYATDEEIAAAPISVEEALDG